MKYSYIFIYTLFIGYLIRTNKLRYKRFQITFQFIDNLYAMNDGGKFGKAFLEIYSIELELTAEQNGSHAAFLYLDVSIDKCKFIYKMFDKRHALNCHAFRMQSIICNIPSIIFYSSTMSEFVQIDRSTLLFKAFCV